MVKLLLLPFRLLSLSVLCFLLCECKSHKANSLEEWTILGEAKIITNSLPLEHRMSSNSYGIGPVEPIAGELGWSLMSRYINGKTQFALHYWADNNIYYLWRIPEATGNDYDPYWGCTHMFIDSYGKKKFVVVKVQ